MDNWGYVYNGEYKNKKKIKNIFLIDLLSQLKRCFLFFFIFN